MNTTHPATTRRPRRIAPLIAAIALALAGPAAAIEIVGVYSSADGEYQAIVLEDPVADAVDRFAGVTLEMTDRAGEIRRYTLGRQRIVEAAPIVDGRRRFLVATRLLARHLRAQAVMPDAFVAHDGGTLLAYATLPRVHPHVAPLSTAVASHAFDSAAVPTGPAIARHPRRDPPEEPRLAADPWLDPSPAPIVREYRHAQLDHYVLATTQQEKAALDFAPRRGWQRTGRYFRALAPEIGNLAIVPVCRYYLPPPHGDTHVFAATADECGRVPVAVPAAILETPAAFHVALPDAVTGSCMPQASLLMPAATPKRVALYRAWNGRTDTNHRYSTHAEDRDEMVSRGWVAEGIGTAQVSMCVDDFDVGTTPVPKLPPKIESPGG